MAWGTYEPLELLQKGAVGQFEHIRIIRSRKVNPSFIASRFHAYPSGVKLGAPFYRWCQWHHCRRHWGITQIGLMLNIGSIVDLVNIRT